MWILTPQRQQIAASDFTLDNEAEPFDEGLDRPIEPIFPSVAASSL